MTLHSLIDWYFCQVSNGDILVVKSPSKPSISTIPKQKSKASAQRVVDSSHYSHPVCPPRPVKPPTKEKTPPRPASPLTQPRQASPLSRPQTASPLSRPRQVIPMTRPQPDVQPRSPILKPARPRSPRWSSSDEDTPPPRPQSPVFHHPLVNMQTEVKIGQSKIQRLNKNINRQSSSHSSDVSRSVTPLSRPYTPAGDSRSTTPQLSKQNSVNSLGMFTPVSCRSRNINYEIQIGYFIYFTKF